MLMRPEPAAHLDGSPSQFTAWARMMRKTKTDHVQGSCNESRGPPPQHSGGSPAAAGCLSCQCSECFTCVLVRSQAALLLAGGRPPPSAPRLRLLLLLFLRLF